MTCRISRPVVVATVLPNIGGWFGRYIVKRNLNPWYESLKKPSWTVPNWAFGPIWSSIYCTMGYSSYLVWRDGGGFQGAAAVPLTFYGINLALNWAWTPIFFGMRDIKLALYEILVLGGSSVTMGLSFYQVNSTAGYLTIPYLVWLSIATAINYAIYRDNCAIEDAEEKEE